jgi:preprotein translocase subunit SecG
MQIWMTVILAVQLLSALTMIGLVLVQHGKGADMGASFGSGASGSLFGATGSANFLSRSTAALATVFFVCTLALAYMSNVDHSRSVGPAGGGSSVLDRPTNPASAPAPGTIPGAIPGAATDAAPAATSTPVQPAVPAPVPGAANEPAPAASK